MFSVTYQRAIAAHEEFWKREKRTRPLLSIQTWPQKPFRAPVSLEQKWLDETYILAAARYEAENSYYAGEAVPRLFTNLGPGCMAACMGTGYWLAEHTVWFDRAPIMTDWAEMPPLRLDRESEMWRHLDRLQTAFYADGEINASATDIGGVMDVLCSLRGTENLLYDLYDYPEEVKAASEQITDLWLEVFDQQMALAERAGQPYNTWMNLPSLQPWYPLQCDFCAMISPWQFEEFVLPHLARQVAHMPRSIYHLDGPGELPHIDMILELEGLSGIQWVPGDGEAPLWDEKWFPLYRKIQDKKKNLVLGPGISQYDEAGAERLIKSIDPVGVQIAASASDPAAAERMIENVEKWSS